MRGFRKVLILFLAACMMIGCSNPTFAYEASQESVSIEDAIAWTGEYLLETVENPQVGSIGGEWAVLGLARSGFGVPQSWYDTYYENLVSYVRENDGTLHEKKYTEYSRVILALTAIGEDPTDVGGYNLLEKLGDYDSVVWQGINGPIFALMALDSGSYEIPACEGTQVKSTRELLIETIVSRQLSDDGFSLGGESADPDTTAMALQALAPYAGRDDIEGVVDDALERLSDLQNSDGSYSSYGTANLESSAQVIVALTALGIDPGTDGRFIKNGSSVVDSLMSFFVTGGGFKHIADNTGPNGMATEQGFYALAAYERFLNGENSLYDMGDAAKLTSGQETAGLADKDPDVKACPVIYPGMTFDDIAGIESQEAVEALVSRGIITGTGDSIYEPDRTMTRAEFATVVVRALGLTPSSNTIFTDVPETSWYAPYVGTAYTYGIVNGTSETEFSPEDTISREQAAAMVARASALCGLDTEMTDAETRDMLAQFPDYTTSSVWARESLTFCYKLGILSQDDLNIEPGRPVTRAEIADMIYIMLQKAELI